MVQTLEADRLAGHFAIAKFAIVDPAQGGVDFRHQLALPIPRAQFQRAIGFF